jgi:xanthine dehydrogenase YagT iron-sulfur-binding subunit
MAEPFPTHIVSRRSLLSSAGVVTGAVALLGEIGSAVADDGPAILGPDAVPVTLSVNGLAHHVHVTPGATLAEVLRGELDLTGTKIGCDRGACSACTVWLDGAPVASCMMLAVDVGGRAITTIEGLAQGAELHPVQQAFIAHDAVQCGYCTPGMVMSAAALLQRNPHPTASEAQAAISGHVCRCGTYPHVIDAVLAVSEGAAHHG